MTAETEVKQGLHGNGNPETANQPGPGYQSGLEAVERPAKKMRPEELHLFYAPRDRLRLTVGDEYSVRTVKPVWAAPLTRAGKYLALVDGDGKEITLVVDPERLAKESLAAVQEELRRRYLTARVFRVTHARQEFGATYWTVETDRGRRELVTQNLQENALWFSDIHLLLVDVDGNRFEIPDLHQLDPRSQEIIEETL